METLDNFTRFLSFELSPSFANLGPMVWVTSVTSAPDVDI